LVSSDGVEVTPELALHIESGLERTIVGRATPAAGPHTSQVRHPSFGWRRLHQAASLFAGRHTCSHPVRTMWSTITVTAPLAGATAITTALAFAPIYVASGFAPQIPAGCLAMALHVWGSATLHECAHASVVIVHRRRPVLIERRGLTPCILVEPVSASWGFAYALSGPAAGVLSCVAGAMILNPHGLGLVPLSIAVVHLANLSAGASDGRFLRAALRPVAEHEATVHIEIVEPWSPHVTGALESSVFGTGGRHHVSGGPADS
jgi:hypothetical protein